MAFFNKFKRLAGAFLKVLKRLARPFYIFKESALELKNIRCIVVTAMFMALDLAIKSLTITVIPGLKISFSFLAKASIGMLFGPTVGFIEGTLSDLVGYLLKPTGDFSPMFTLVEAFSPMIYGLFLYKLKFSRTEISDKSLQKQSAKEILKIVLGKLTVVVVCNLFLTPLAYIISDSLAAGEFVYGAQLAKYPARLIKNAIQLPVDCIMLIGILPIVLSTYNLVFKGNKRFIRKVTK